MCKDKSIKTQSYFQSVNEQALTWLKSREESWVYLFTHKQRFHQEKLADQKFSS